MFIYVLRNKVNGKCYVGQDSGSLEKRVRVMAHFAALKAYLKGKPPKYESKLVPALAKYGLENFEVTIHSAGYTTKVDLDLAEVNLISELDSIKNGYNIMPGGQGFIANKLIDDPVILEKMFDLRSRGAKTCNEKRWNNASDEERQEAGAKMRSGHSDGWRQKIKDDWDSMSADARLDRQTRMKLGRPSRFILVVNGEDKMVETNLRTLLSNLNTSIPKRQIENAVRTEKKFICSEFQIEQRTVR